MDSPITVVTGATRGIGAATAIRLAAAGHRLVLSYLSDGAAAESVATTVRDLGTACVTVRADTTRADDVDRLFDEAAKLGQVTGLVNNAGTAGRLGPLVEAGTGGPAPGRGRQRGRHAAVHPPRRAAPRC